MSFLNRWNWKKWSCIGTFLLLSAVTWLVMQGDAPMETAVETIIEAPMHASAKASAEAHTEKKKIALTFDDGPHPVYTEKLLDGLKEKQVKATFFLLGENIEGNEELVKRIAEEGHLIGNHTFQHEDITKVPKEKACQQILKTSDLIHDITGITPEYIRPPFGEWDDSLDCGINLFLTLWTIDTLDWTTRNTSEIVNRVVTKAEENDIILMHDSFDSTVKAVMQVIDLLEAENYEFVTVDEILLD